ncbi:MAG: RNA polymerase factor sigma-54 [Firmicutes bacterium]|nr:RNA polymerase factor sigma-54 [Dethiobacter sp.]MBS3888194.1 RNA polymerase factor sigma-54 [Bacillota bacterium]
MRPELQQAPSLRQHLVMTPELRQAIQLLPMTAAELEAYLVREAAENPLLEVERSNFELPSGLSFGVLRAPCVAEPADPRADLRLEVNLCRAPYAVRQAASMLVDSLDERGYLPPLDAVLADELGVSLALLWQGKALLQSLGPAGFAAENLGESLLLQLAQANKVSADTERIVTMYLREGCPSADKVAAILDLPKPQVQKVLAELQNCSPSPGGAYAARHEVGTVYPDICIVKTSGGYRAKVNQPGVNEINMKRVFHELFACADQGTKEYLRARYHEGLWLARAIKQRLATLERLAAALIKFQYAFLEHGKASLRPLTMSAVASEAGVHESTVSRAVSHKFALTPQGVVPLKSFFSSHVHSLGGEVASLAVKERISQLIAAENRKSPLTDSQVQDLLTAEGINISRRTVAKYREALSILPRSHRKAWARG